MMPASSILFDTLAADYDEHFRVPHRALYDQLAWEYLEHALPSRDALIIDAGCGSGRWGARLIAAGHRVLGIEPAPKMAAATRARGLGPRFTLIEGAMEDVELDQRADVVLAMGSLQYTRDPELMVHRLADWTCPGGRVLVLVDSLVALVIEQLRDGREQEALVSLQTERGIWRHAGQVAELELLSAARLQQAFRDAGLVDVAAHGLLVSASALDRDVLAEQLTEDADAQLILERKLARNPLLADLGKQLLVVGTAADPSRGPASP